MPGAVVPAIAAWVPEGAAVSLAANPGVVRIERDAGIIGAAGFDPLYGYGLVNAGPALIPAPSALTLALLGASVLHRRRRSAALADRRSLPEFSTWNRETISALDEEAPHPCAGFSGGLIVSSCVRGEWTALMPYNWQNASTSRR